MDTNYDNRDLKNGKLPLQIVRQRAIEWWESLTLEVIDLQEKYYPYAGTPQNLTGYQIQQIWKKETGGHVA